MHTKCRQYSLSLSFAADEAEEEKMTTDEETCEF